VHVTNQTKPGQTKLWCILDTITLTLMLVKRKNAVTVKVPSYFGTNFCEIFFKTQTIFIQLTVHLVYIMCK